MPTIYNNLTLKECNEGANLQQNRENTPTRLAESIVPVMEVNPKMLRRCNLVAAGTATDATGATIYTAPTDKDLYLVAAVLSVIKDVNATSTVSELYVTTEEGGASKDIIRIPGITATVQNQTVSVSFPTPLKIKRGTIIGINNGTNVAKIIASGCITGFLV
jgi:hypothetical protein